MASPQRKRGWRSSELEREIESKIAEVGWYALAVFPAPGEPPEAFGWTYTIGLQASWGHPELIVTGLEPRIAHAQLGAAVEIIKGGGRLEHDSELEGILAAPLRLAVRAVANWQAAELMPWAEAYERRQGLELEALQLIWPDRDGRFPWDPRYADEAQPLLAL
jgi:hypothetical protein